MYPAQVIKTNISPIHSNTANKNSQYGGVKTGFHIVKGGIPSGAWKQNVYIALSVPASLNTRFQRSRDHGVGMVCGKLVCQSVRQKHSICNLPTAYFPGPEQL